MEYRERPQVSFTAEEKGCKYIELRLDPREGRNQQPKIRFYGVRIIKEQQDGRDRRSGLPNYRLTETGGFILFTLDKERRAWFADLLDDEKGENRKFLAQHLVSEETIKKDRAEINNKKIKSGYKYTANNNTYKAGESPFIIVDPDIRHAVANIRKELDGGVVSEPERITPLVAAETEIARLKKLQAEKDAKYEEEKKAILNMHVKATNPAERLKQNNLRKEIQKAAAAKALELQGEQPVETGAPEKPEIVDA